MHILVFSNEEIGSSKSNPSHRIEGSDAFSSY